MSTVTVLGYGNMGSALVTALVAAGHRVTVWNRSDKEREVQGARAAYAADAADAVSASDLVIACLAAGYEATDQVLASPGVAEALKGRTLVQLATGMPEEGPVLARWCEERGIPYLDGKIAVLPASIGDESAVIFYAGPREVFDQHRATLVALAGNSVHVGEKAGDSSYADFGFLCFFFMSTIGMMYASAFFEAAGLDKNQFLELTPHFAKDITDRAPSVVRALAEGDFTSRIQSSLHVDSTGAGMLARTADGLELQQDPARFISETLGAAAASGLAGEDTSALVKFFLQK